MKKLLCLTVIAVLTGCAATYEQPKIAAPDTNYKIKGTQAELLRKAKIALAGAGYQITTSDMQAGIVTTAPRDLRLTPAQADCGKTMGIDYLKDNRTSTRVAINVIANDNVVTVKANMQGEYKPGKVDQDITLTCISRGVIEQQLADQISGS